MSKPPADAGSGQESWKARFAQARAARDEAMAERAKLLDEVADARRSIGVAKHEILEAATLQRLFPHRLRTLRARTSAADAARREIAFRATAAAYGILEDGAAIESSVVDGLRWYLPAAAETVTDAADWAAKQRRFPFNAILQTRDVSIGGLMLDVGANVGRVAIPRVVLGDVTAVYCAEPDASNYQCLLRNVLENGLGGFVMPDRVAITDRDGTVKLRRARKYTGHRVVGDEETSGDVIEVTARTLDTWVGHHGIDLDAVTFIKVDVEGHEQQVLDGATGVLASRHIAWQLEVWARQLAAAGHSASGLTASLARHFSHFVDLRRGLPAPRVRPIAEIHALGAELDRSDSKTDVVVFNAG